MRIAITDLKDYNEAILRYEWLDLEEVSSTEEIGKFIEAFLEKRSKERGELHEEWFLTDYEDFVDLGEYPSLEDIETAVRLSKQFGWEAVAKHYSSTRTFDDFEEAYQGLYESEEDFAYELAHNIYSDAQLGQLELYIDWERVARDLFIGDYESEEVKGGIAVFKRM